MRALAITFICFCLSGSICAQSNGSSYLGLSRLQVLATLGNPSAVMSPTTHKVFGSAMHERVLLNSGTVIDLYQKTYGTIEFGIDILYRLDASSSRLHPVERVGHVTYTPDKRISFEKLIAALPPTRHLCQSGCKMLLAITSGVSYTVFIYPDVISNEQRGLAAKIADGFSGSSTANDEYTPSLEVTFNETPKDTNDVSVQFFDKLVVDTISLDVTDPNFEEKNASKFIKIDFSLAR